MICTKCGSKSVRKKKHIFESDYQSREVGEGDLNVWFTVLAPTCDDCNHIFSEDQLNNNQEEMHDYSEWNR